MNKTRILRILLLSAQCSDEITHEVMKVGSDMVTIFVQSKQKTCYINISRNYHCYCTGSETPFIVNDIIVDENLD